MMTNKRWNSLLLFNFLLILLSIIILGNYYKDIKSRDYTTQLYSELSSSIVSKVTTLISEKKNATLTISLSQSQNSFIRKALLNNLNTKLFLQDLSLQLRKETDFKNVWFQLINKDGVSIARSWTDKSGDNLSKIREDVKSMKNKPMIKTTISVGKFDMSFKAMVPVFSDDGEYMGIFETITHFNSIAKKIDDKGFHSIVLVDKKYNKQLKHPFTNLFVGENYVANKSADKKYLDLIALNGTDTFTSVSENYIIDNENGNIVINYTLFDQANMPMARFFIFKPLNEIKKTEVESMEYIINIFMLFSTVVVIFMFLLLFNKRRDIKEYDDGIFKYLLAFFMLFALLSFVYYQFLRWNYEDNKDDYLKNYNKTISTEYSIIYNKFISISETVFETNINTPKVIEVIYNSYESEEAKQESRERLFEMLIGKYEYLKKLNIRQLHFHLKNNESFLRFHRPKKYGDNLTGVRHTVEWVNKNNQFINGFEEGRIYNGFRNVFPLTYKDNKTGKEHHIGSVETSFSPYAIADEFVKIYDAKAGFIIASKVVDTKVFNEELSNYKQSLFKDFYYEKTLEKQLKLSLKHINIENINQKDFEIANKKIFDGDVFTIVSEDEDYLYTFIPIKNPVSKKVVASMILEFNNSILKEYKENFLLMLFIGIASLIVIVLFIYREYAIKNKLKEITFKTQRILDTQDSIVFTKNFNEILDVNKRFLEFFGYSSLDEYKNENGCICDKFIENENYFSDIDNNGYWLEGIKSLPKKQRIVLMSDTSGNKHSFAVSFSDFGKDKYIVTFTDITQTIEDNIQLEEKVVRDKLTGAYNREFFDNKIAFMLDSCKLKGECLGLILLDIDHFKNINDTYGHNRGDIILKELTKLVQASIRKDDYLIRWGGEEFIVICNSGSVDGTKNVAEHLRKEIEKLSLEEIGHITCSFGAIVINSDEDMVKNIERADKALYKAKSSGRNRVEIG